MLSDTVGFSTECYVVWKFSQFRVVGGQFAPREPKLVLVIGSFEKSRVRKTGGEITVWSMSEANSMATRFGSRYREVRETEGSRNRDSTVFMSLNLLLRLSTRNDLMLMIFAVFVQPLKRISY